LVTSAWPSGAAFLRHRRSRGLPQPDVRGPCLVTPGDHDPCPPAGCAPAARWLDRLHLHPGAGDDPAHHRVGVPHLTRAQLVAAPSRRWHRRNEVKYALGTSRILAQKARTIHSLAEVRDDAVTPASHLIPKDSQPSGPAISDRTTGHNPAKGGIAAPDRRLLDDEAALRCAHFERRMVEGADGSAGKVCGHPLKHAPVVSHRVAAGAQRQPVQAHLSRRGTGAATLRGRSAPAWSSARPCGSVAAWKEAGSPICCHSSSHSPHTGSIATSRAHVIGAGADPASGNYRTDPSVAPLLPSTRVRRCRCRFRLHRCRRKFG
jgi:hypothetical protein